MADFDLTHWGKRYLLAPLTDAAQEWIIEHIQTGPMNEGDAAVIDETFIVRILRRIADDGLTVDS